MVRILAPENKLLPLHISNSLGININMMSADFLASVTIRRLAVVLTVILLEREDGTSTLI